MIKVLMQGRKGVLYSAMAGLMMAGWSLSSQAQVACTVENWGGTVNEDSLFAGSPQQGNKRFAGPCSLKVDLDDDMAYVLDDSPVGEADYIARFYFNPNGNDSADAPMIIFAANVDSDGTGDDVLQVWYNVASADPFVATPNHITLVIQTADGEEEIRAGAAGVRANGWNSVEIVWQADADADVVMNVNGQADLSATGIDTSGLQVNSAMLGFVGYPSDPAVTSSTPMYFDDFDSRRQTRPGRLCRGLTDESRDSIDLADFFNIYADFASGGNQLATGQPDYNEDGIVDLVDAFAVYDAFAAGQNSCDLNR